MKTMAITALALLIASAGLGIWIGISGNPYNTILFTLHKLTGIACFVLCVLFFINSMRGSGLAAGDIVLAVSFVISAAALLAGGGIMSAKQPTVLLRIVHTAAVVALSLSAGWKLIGFLIG